MTHPSISSPPREGGNPDEMPLFGGMHSAADLDRLEGGRHTTTQVAYFEGGLSKNLDLRLTNPKDGVECYVKPGRGQSLGVPEQGPEGPTKLRLERHIFEANRANLATPAEMARILANARSPRAHEVTRQIQDLRMHNVRARQESQDPEEAARIEARRAQYRAEEGEGAQLAQQATQAALSTGPAAAAKWAGEAEAAPRTPAELAQREDAIRASYARAGQGMSPKAKERLREAMIEELDELRAAYEAEVAKVAEQAKAPQPIQARSIKERLADLLDLYTGSLIDEATYKQRQAQILAEV